jgi:hypothetical protein
MSLDPAVASSGADVLAGRTGLCGWTAVALVHGGSGGRFLS